MAAKHDDTTKKKKNQGALSWEMRPPLQFNNTQNFENLNTRELLEKAPHYKVNLFIFKQRMRRKTRSLENGLAVFTNVK